MLTMVAMNKELESSDFDIISEVSASLEQSMNGASCQSESVSASDSLGSARIVQISHEPSVSHVS